MSTIELIERDVEQLDDKAFASFREWFLEHDHARWDKQIAADSASGKLNVLIEGALADHRAGKSTPL